MNTVLVGQSESWARSGGGVAVYVASGLITAEGLLRIHREAATGLASEAAAIVFDCSRAVLAVSGLELVAIALGDVNSHRIRRLTGAWVVPSVNVQDCRMVALQLATYGIARRVFTAFAPALAWAKEEAALRR